MKWLSTKSLSWCSGSLLFQAIQEQMKMHATEPVGFDDVKNEIFDMVKPADPLKLTLQDLIRRLVVSW